jgi:hypothetical protein
MRLVTSTIAAFALAGAVSVFAQEQAPAQPPAREPAPAQAPTKDPAPAQSPAAESKATLTGCVVQAKTTDGGTAYVLSKAEGGSATMYVLGGAAEKEKDWSANVNKKVEVTGPVQEPAGAADKQGAAAPGVVRPPLVVVESMKVVGQSCT